MLLKNNSSVNDMHIQNVKTLTEKIEQSDAILVGAAASMSGGADIRPFPDSWNMKEQLGEYASNKDVWDAHTVMSQLDRISNGDIALLIDCGDDDFFLEVNQELHRQLLSRKIGHDFITRPGAHTVTYWNNSIDYHLLFFQKFFTRGEQVGQ